MAWWDVGDAVRRFDFIGLLNTRKLPLPQATGRNGRPPGGWSNLQTATAEL